MATLYVAIYRASDTDIPHWCLYTMGDYGNEAIYEALGSAGKPFRYGTRSVVLRNTRDLYRTVKIGRIEADVWTEVAALLSGVPMSDSDGWNCQSWVMQGIAALKKEDYLEENKKGMDYIKNKYQKKFGTY